MPSINRAIVRLALLVSLASTGCGATATTPAAAPADAPTAPAEEVLPMPQPPWSVIFSDGSANRFVFEQASPTGAAVFDYRPVQPAESSSGSYSGGAPRVGTLTPVQVGELWSLVERIGGDEARHVAERAMGTGQFEVANPDGERSFIVPPGEDLDAFMAFAQQFRGD